MEDMKEQEKVYLSPKRMQTQIDIPADSKWELTQQGDWFYAHPTKGDGPQSVTLYVDSNPENEEREGTLIVKPEGAPEIYIKLVQADVDMVADNSLDSGQLPLGFGYDIFGNYADSLSLKKGEIFSITKIAKAQEETGERLYATIPIAHTNEYIRTGKSISDFSQSFKISAGVSAEYMAFAAQLKTSFGSDFSKTEEEEYAQFTYKLTKNKQFLT